MDTFIIILIHLIVWPLVVYGLGLIVWWTLISDEGKKVLKKDYEKVVKKSKENV